MKNWFKTMLCAVSAATLVACGGGDYVDPNPAAPAPGGGTASAGAITGIAGQMELAAGLAIDGIGAGFFGDFTTLSIPTGLESPSDMVMPEVYMPPHCANEDGSALPSEADDATRVTYTNCVIDGSTLNGVVDITVQSEGVYLVEFDPVAMSPFKITASEDGTTITYTYSGNQVVSDLARDGEGEYTSMNVVLNADVKIGTGSTVTLTDFEIDFTKTETEETITLDGDYSATIKLSDFGVPVVAPMPETAVVAFTVTTPTAVVVNLEQDKETAGIIKFASTLFALETNYATRKITLTVTGAPPQEFPFE